MSRTVSATHPASGRDFYIGPDADDDDQAFAESLYTRLSERPTRGREMVECREHDDDPTLAHLRSPEGLVHGIWVYLKKLAEGTPQERWVVVHFDGRSAHYPRVGKSKQHQREQDAWQDAASAIGYPAVQEHPLPGIRCDLLIRGPRTDVDVEVQRTFIKKSAAQERTRRARKAGVQSVWSTDHLTDWSQKNSVPHIRTNPLPAGHSVPDTWVVVGGLRDVFPERCSPITFGKCPSTGRGIACGRHHPRLTPKYGVRVYDVVEQAPAGELVQLETGRQQGTVLVTPEHWALWAELVAESGLAKPPRQTPNQRGPVHTTALRPGFEETVQRHQFELFAPDPTSAPLCAACTEEGLSGVGCLTCRQMGRGGV